MSYGTELKEVIEQLKRIADALEKIESYMKPFPVLTMGGKAVEVVSAVSKTVEPPKGKYEWFPLKDGGKVRKCSNKGCPLYLHFSDEKKKYEHGKYDLEKKEFFYVQDVCNYYTPEGK